MGLSLQILGSSRLELDLSVNRSSHIGFANDVKYNQVESVTAQRRQSIACVVTSFIDSFYQSFVKAEEKYFQEDDTIHSISVSSCEEFFSGGIRHRRTRRAERWFCGYCITN
jgi:hypothetical protein